MHFRSRTLFLPLALAALALGACDDATEIEDHPEAEGLAIVRADDPTTELYRYMLDDGTPESLGITVGAHDVIVVLLDHDGSPLAHEEAEGEEEEVEITASPASVLTWTPEADTGEVHESVEIHGTLTGVAAGSATFGVCLLHEGHCDFDVSIPVTVTAVP